MEKHMQPKIYSKSYGGLNLDKWYNDEITEASFKELVNLTKWINEKYGYHPVVIGGWAVYFYTNSLGSRDIDIVFPDKTSIDKVLIPYYRTMGYKSEGLFSKSYHKEIKTKKGIEKIILDACSLSNRNILHENKDIEIPWKLTVKYYNNWEIKKDINIQIPTKELLLIYKIKALCDRRYDLKHKSISSADRDYINSKIWKDEHDIKQLSKYKMDYNRLNLLLEDYNFKKYFKREKERLELELK